MKCFLFVFFLTVCLFANSSSETNRSTSHPPIPIENITQIFGHQTVMQQNAEFGFAHRVIPSKIQQPVIGDIKSATEEFIAKHFDVFRVNETDTKVEVHQKIDTRDILIYRQLYNGIPVYQSKIDFRYHNNRLVWFGADTYPNININTIPQINRDEVLSLAKFVVNYDANNQDFISEDPSLYVFVESPEKYRLAWKLGLYVHHDNPDLYELPVSNYTVWVDAHSSEIISIFDRVEKVEIQGRIMGMVKDVPYGFSSLRPMEDIKVTVSGVGETFTDENGFYSIEAGTVQRQVTVNLLGHFLNINAANTNDAEVSMVVTPGDTFNVLFNVENSLAGERDTYYHANLIHDWIKQIDWTFTGVDYVMPADVNIGAEDSYWPCNAYWDGFGINMFSAGGGCSATDQMADVIYHEYQHGITQFAYAPFESPSSSGMGEGFSDYAAMTLRNSPCLGDAFFGTPGECLRNGENTLQYPGDDCGGGVHCLGQLSMGSLWQMRKNLIAAFGDTLTAVTHSDSLFRLAMIGRPYSVPDLLIEILTADDNDGNIYNGTPNFQAIIDGFDQHGVPSPLPEFGIIHTPIANLESANQPILIEAIILGLDPTILTATLVLAINNIEMTIPLSPGNTSNTYIGEIPPQQPGTIVTYYISAADAGGTEYFSPVNAPNITHFFLVGSISQFPILFSVYVESDNGWSLGDDNDDATVGVWERADPIGTTTNGQQVQPEDDHSEPGTQTFVTGNVAFDGTNSGAGDVDNGKTTLLSPVMNLIGTINPVFTYWRWYTNHLGNAPQSDEWVVQVTSDGQTWVDLERTTESMNSWVYQQFLLEQFVPLTETVRVRFIAQDTGDGSLVEAAVDDISLISAVQVNMLDGDPDFDGLVTVADLLMIFEFVLNHTQPLPLQRYVSDYNHDGILNFMDAFLLVQTLINP